MPSLLVVPIYFTGPPRHLSELMERLGRTLGLAPREEAAAFDPEQAFDRHRGQYNSTTLLARLLQARVEPGDRILGLSGVDLFIPVLTYVFGEAQLDGPAAVVSSYRLENTLYGLPHDEAVYLDRLEKEAVHELGHTFGLMHCDDLDCVMHASTYVEDIDLKSARFCADCLRAVRRSTR